MIRCLTLLLIAALPGICQGQFSLNARYTLGQSDVLSKAFIYQNGQHVSLEYNFRLKQKRLEFRPGIGYRNTFNGEFGDGHFSAADLDVGVAIYPFDFAGDCHCPTFSKEGELFKKGFFLEVIPGVGLQKFERVDSRISDHLPFPIQNKHLIGKIGGAAGLDIGILRQLTLTPMISVTYLTSTYWDGLNTDGTISKLNDYMYYGFGIRLTYSIKEKFLRRRH
ncbi:MAG: hypothetical protein WAT91_13215 [Saprospiraceae bacterium]